MEDNRINVLERLAAADPARSGSDLDQAHADRVLAAILSEPRPERPVSRRQRRLVVVALAAGVVAIAAPALAFDGVRSLIGLDHPLPVLEESRLLVSAPVAEGTVARLWISPSTSGGECLFQTFGPPGDVEHAPEMGGGLCKHPGVISWEGIPLTLQMGATKRPLVPRGAREWIPPVISGRVDPELAAARVEVRWTGGSRALTLANEYFIGAVEEIYEPPLESEPFFLVAYDAAGNEVARRKLEAMRLE